MTRINFLGDCRGDLELVKVDGGIEFTVPLMNYLVLDNVKGWISYDLPNDLLINNKTVVPFEKIPDLLNILNYFVDKYCLPDSLSKSTSRGFFYMDFCNLSIQESSSDGCFMWFGFSIEEKTLKHTDGRPFKLASNNDVLINDRLHLSRFNVQVLIKSIEAVMEGNNLPNIAMKKEEFEWNSNYIKFVNTKIISSCLYCILNNEDYYSGEDHDYTRDELKNIFDGLLNYIFFYENPSLVLSLKESQFKENLVRGLFGDDLLSLWVKIANLDGYSLTKEELLIGFKDFDESSMTKESVLEKLMQITDKAM